MYSLINTTAICEEETITNLFTFVTLLLFSLLIAGLLLNSCLMIALQRERSLPFSVQVLLKNLTVSVTLCIVSYIVFIFNNVINVLLGHMTSIYKTTCTVMGGFVVLASCFESISLFTLGLDRYFATKNVVKHAKRALAKLESNNQLIIYKYEVKKILLMIVVCFCIACTTGTTWFLNLHFEKWENDFACYCDAGISTDINVQILFPILLFYLGAEICVCSLYVYVWWLNVTKLADFSINTARHSLQERFEIRQNIQGI